MFALNPHMFRVVTAPTMLVMRAVAIFSATHEPLNNTFGRKYGVRSAREFKTRGRRKSNIYQPTKKKNPQNTT